MLRLERLGRIVPRKITAGNAGAPCQDGAAAGHATRMLWMVDTRGWRHQRGLSTVQGRPQRVRGSALGGSSIVPVASPDGLLARREAGQVHLVASTRLVGGNDAPNTDPVDAVGRRG